MSSQTQIVKTFTMILMYIIIIITGIVPLRVKSFRENQKILSIASAFSGGLFLSVGLIHILPEAAEDFNNYLSSTNHFPFQMLITVASFSLLLLIDKVIGGQLHGVHHHEDNEDGDDKCDEVQEKKNDQIYENHNSCSIYEDSETSYVQYHDYNSIQNIVKYNQQQYTSTGNNNLQLQNEIKNGQSQNIFSINGIEENLDNSQIQIEKIIKKTIDHTQNRKHNLNQVKTIQSLNNQVSQFQQKRNSHPQDDLFQRDMQPDLEENIVKLEINEHQKKNFQYFAPFVLQAALGIHACLEGLAIGVEQNFSRCLTIALAVLAHKWAEGLVLGLALKKSNMKVKKAYLMIAVQAAMNPIGIAIGWILSDSGSLVSGILMSISAGTFIYISTQEVIAEEFSKIRYQVTKFLFYLLGVGFVSSLYYVQEATEE
ncbi:hypothetical protein ABPG74_008196 [Tetrahymena malaccensis]